jgi:hypothetical protein
MHRKHRKELIKLAKEDREWDWAYLHDIVIAKIRHMYAYYSAGNNVWQTDETLLPTIDELKHVLDLQEELDNVFKDVPHPETTVNSDKSLTFTWSEEARQCRDAAYKRHDELYEEIYSYIGKHLQGWWD